jgi:hypothetical protein
MNKARAPLEKYVLDQIPTIVFLQAVELLRQGQMDQAIEDLVAFNSKANSKVASAASNNLALINIVVKMSNLK